MQRGDEKIPVRLVGFQNGSMIFKATFWAANLTQANLIFWELNKSVKQRFDEARIKMGAPSPTVVIQNSDLVVGDRI